MNSELITIIIFGYILDLIFGDPQWRWHPVRIIGRLAELLEEQLNKGKINRIFSGSVLVILVVSITVFSVWAVLKFAYLIHPVLYYVFSVLLIYFSLSMKALGVEANKVLKHLKDKDLGEARRDLSMIVGRDTDKLKETEVVRATVETTAESTMDGVVAPLFYAFLGGPVLAWAYKAINTLDSMFGHKNERFLEFGRLSAKLDGLANLVPAKITCFLINISSFFYGKDAVNSVKWAGRYLFKGPEYNGESVEASLAGALGIQLGGTNFYNSTPVLKALIGNNLFSLDKQHIKESLQITYFASTLFMFFRIFFYYLLGRR